MRALAAQFAKTLKSGDVIALTGTLGAGKTTFTRAVLRAAGIRKKITSPTFVMFVPYRRGSVTFYHFDLYRASSFKELEALGMTEIFQDEKAITFVEWADKFPTHLPARAIRINIEHGDTPTSRRVTIKNGRIEA